MMDERKTSVSKDVKLDSYETHLLDIQAELSKEFNGSANEREQVQTERADSRGEQAQGSEMIRQEMPQLNNTPPPQMARGQDRQTFNEKLQKDDANSYLESLKDIHAESREDFQDRSNDYGNENSR